MSASANNSSGNNQNDEHQCMVLFMVLILACVLVAAFQSEIYYACCVILYCLWEIIDFPRFHTLVAGKMNILTAASKKTGNLTLSRFLEMLDNTAGIPPAWPAAASLFTRCHILCHGFFLPLFRLAIMVIKKRCY